MANNNEMELFQFDGQPVRTVTDENKETFWVAKDVCDRLGYANATDAVKRHCRGVARHYPIIDNLGRTQEARIISESDLLRLICASRLPEAQRFERWVFEVVLPTIRKTGGYIAAKPEDPPEVIMAKALKVADATISDYKLRLENAHKQIAELKPAAEYTEKVLSSTNLHTVKSIGVHLGVSAQKLNDFLISQDWIYKQGRIYYPTSKICGKGLCDYQINAYVADPYTKEVRTREHLKWTEKGRQAVIQLWNETHGVLDFGC